MIIEQSKSEGAKGDVPKTRTVCAPTASVLTHSLTEIRSHVIKDLSKGCCTITYTRCLKCEGKKNLNFITVQFMIRKLKHLYL